MLGLLLTSGSMHLKARTPTKSMNFAVKQDFPGPCVRKTFALNLRGSPQVLR